MKRLGIVDSESTALIIGDAAALQHWRGNDNQPETGARFFTAVNAASAGVTVTLADTAACLWYTEGSGPVDVYALLDGSLLLVHAWIEGDDDSDVDALAMLPAAETEDAGEIRVLSGTLGILWSAEEGSCIETTADGTFQLNSDGMFSESCGLLIPLPNGTYRCLCDAVQSEEGEAVRCRLMPKDCHAMHSPIS